MANKLIMWLLARFLHRRAQVRAVNDPTVAPRPAPPTDPGHRLISRPQPHERIVQVPRNRVVLILETGQPTVIARPPVYLWPPIVPRRRPMTLLVINTGVVQLVLQVRGLVTLDGYAITHATLTVAVQLSDVDGYGKLARTAAEADGELEQHLLARAERELGDEVQVAVRMNRLGDLRRLTLNEVLRLRGLPKHLAGGILDLRSVVVAEVGWPAAPTAPAAPAAPDASGTEVETRAPAVERLDLSTDAKLRRLWLTHSEVDLDGIESAHVGGASTVVAVPQRTLGLADLFAVKEAFRRQLDDRLVTVVATPAHSYTELVQGWFRQIDTSPARLVAVRPSSHDGLRIIVEQSLRTGDGELQVGSPADREALRRLLPHNRLEFIASDEPAALADQRR